MPTAGFDHEFVEAPHFQGHVQRFYQTLGLSHTVTGGRWLEKLRPNASQMVRER